MNRRAQKAAAVSEKKADGAWHKLSRIVPVKNKRYAGRHNEGGTAVVRPSRPNGRGGLFMYSLMQRKYAAEAAHGARGE